MLSRCMKLAIIQWNLCNRPKICCTFYFVHMAHNVKEDQKVQFKSLLSFRDMELFCSIKNKSVLWHSTPALTIQTLKSSKQTLNFGRHVVLLKLHENFLEDFKCEVQRIWISQVKSMYHTQQDTCWGNCSQVMQQLHSLGDSVSVFWRLFTLPHHSPLMNNKQCHGGLFEFHLSIISTPTMCSTFKTVTNLWLQNLENKKHVNARIYFKMQSLWMWASETCFKTFEISLIKFKIALQITE